MPPTTRRGSKAPAPPSSASVKQAQDAALPGHANTPMTPRGRRPADVPTDGNPATAADSDPPAPVASAAPIRRAGHRLTTLQDHPPRQSRLAWLLVGGGAAVVIAAAIVIVLATRSTAPTPPATLPEVYQVPGSQDHVAEGTKVTYPDNPPSSGPHYPAPAPWGNYPQALPPERWVHNLEHGGIVILYSCPTRCDQLQQQLAQQLLPRIPNDPTFHEQKVVITPYAGLDHLVRVQAWGWTMPLDSLDTTAILAFYDEHVDKGPEQIP